MAVDVMDRVAELEAFTTSLPPADLLNFKAVLDLPHPERVIAMCPHEDWQRHWITALAIKRASEKKERDFVEGGK